ncbi:MAG: hypothetical protein ACOCZ6_01540 [Nanoarchaeota archaeon]
MGSTFYSKRYKPRLGRRRKRRPKTFKTEEQAKKYAEEIGANYNTIEVLREKKYRVKV